MSDQRETRLVIVNAVLAHLEPRTTIYFRGNKARVKWSVYTGKQFDRQWMTRGQDFYPVWKHQWPHGGTMTTALAQLVRYAQGKPVLPLSTWEYWGTDTVALFRNRDGSDSGKEIIGILAASDYPKVATCVLCGKSPIGRFDWWSLDGVSGPMCNYTEECKPFRKEAQDKAIERKTKKGKAEA